jgi:hypothetical protein
MDRSLEVVVLPVSDIDCAIESYRDKVGFHLDGGTFFGFSDPDGNTRAVHQLKVPW